MKKSTNINYNQLVFNYLSKFKSGKTSEQICEAINEKEGLRGKYKLNIPRVSKALYALSLTSRVAKLTNKWGTTSYGRKCPLWCSYNA